MTDARQRTTRQVKIPPEVHEQAFAIWYKLGRCEWGKVHDLLQESLAGARTPSKQALMDWHRTEAWDERADALDGHIEMAQDSEIIQQRKAIIANQAEVGKELIDKGMQYLRDKGIENSADAIRAIGKGAELQDKMLGWAAVFAELSTASDEELNKKLKQYMTGEVLEANAIDANEPDDTERPE